MSITLTKGLLSKYKTRIFIETGSQHGGGVAIALQAGFPLIHSIELNHHYFRSCVNRFKHSKKVKLHHGGSGVILKQILKDINEKVTFWLDAHDWGGGRNPLYRELNAINQHHLKNHNILIDDFKLLKDWNLDQSTVIEKIKKINPNYKIKYHDSRLRKKDILAAFQEVKP